MPDRAGSLVEQVVSHCKQMRFTGVLRIYAREGDGELIFLSGICDHVRFGVSTGDEALERLARATEARFVAVPLLPPFSSSTKRSPPLPTEGALGDLRPGDLMRYCETNALTCVLELTSKGKTARAEYEVGELISVTSETDRDDAVAVAEIVEATEGSYRIILPDFELPEGTPPPTSIRLPFLEPSSKPSSVPRPPSQREPVKDEVRADSEAALQRKAVELAGAKTQPASAKADTSGAAPRAQAMPAKEPTQEKLASEPKPVAKVELAAKQEAEAARQAEAAKPEAEAKKRQAEAVKREAEAEAEKSRRSELAKRQAEANRRAEAEAKRQAEAASKSTADDSAKQRAEAEARRQAAARRQAEEGARPRAEAEAKHHAEIDAKRRADVEAKLRAEAQAQRESAARPEPTPAAKPAVNTQRSAPAEQSGRAGAAQPAEHEPSADDAKAPTSKRATKAKAEAKSEKKRSAETSDKEQATREAPAEGGASWTWLILLLLLAAAAAYYYWAGRR
jgi:hypothetical protein